MSRNPYDPPKTLGDHIEHRWMGENGIYTGNSLSNLAGYESYKRKQQQSSSWNTNSSNTNTNNKVICTELVRQGLMTRSDLIAGARYFEENLSDRHMRGYHLWALAAVRGMRRSRFQTAFWRVLAQARANAITAKHDSARQATTFERLVLRGFDAMCWSLGWKAAVRDWTVLYMQGEALHSVAGDR